MFLDFHQITQFSNTEEQKPEEEESEKQTIIGCLKYGGDNS